MLLFALWLTGSWSGLGRSVILEYSAIFIYLPGNYTHFTDTVCSLNFFAMRTKTKKGKEMSMNNIKKITEVLKLNDYPDIPQYSAESLRRERVIIYGAGSGFITLSMFVLDRFKITPEVVLDKKFSSAENINGIFFCSPDDFAPPPEILTQALVIITIGSPQIRSTIQKHLTEKGFSRIISAMDIYEYHLPAPAEKLTTQGFDFYKSNEKKIIQAFELFADEKSREIFSSYLFTHLFRNSVAIPYEQPANQYFPFELWDKSTYRRSIICGAYNGDTALKTAQNAPDIEAMVCLEPDPENFKSLTDNTKQLKNIIREFSKLFFIFY